MAEALGLIYAWCLRQATTVQTGACEMQILLCEGGLRQQLRLGLETA